MSSGPVECGDGGHGNVILGRHEMHGKIWPPLAPAFAARERWDCPVTHLHVAFGATIV
jgi:hypothetical protein